MEGNFEIKKKKEISQNCFKIRIYRVYLRYEFL